MASINLTSQLATHAQQQSPFFNKLPAELRNRIYKMAFDDDFDTVKLVCIWSGQHDPYIRDIVLCPGPGAPAPPSSAFIRSCQRIHHEAVALFTAAAESYWDNNFIIAPITWWNFEPEGLHIPLECIRNFTFLLEDERFRVDISLRWSERSWSCNVTDKSSPFIDNDDGETRARTARICSVIMFDLTSGHTAGIVKEGPLDLTNMLHFLRAVKVRQTQLEVVSYMWKPTKGVEPVIHQHERLALPSDSTYGPASE